MSASTKGPHESGLAPHDPYADYELPVEPFVGSPDEVERAWEILDPIIEAWRTGTGGALHFYGAGSWGPPAADELLGRDDRVWRRP